jgi:hypothetical protein
LDSGAHCSAVRAAMCVGADALPGDLPEDGKGDGKGDITGTEKGTSLISTCEPIYERRHTIPANQ